MYEKFLVDEGSRLEFLPSLFGVAFCVKVELYAYHVAEQLCAAYHGGYWEFYATDNGSGYMVPRDMPETLDVAWADNYYSGKMSRDAFGLTVMVFAVNHLLNAGNLRLQAQHTKLMELASQHPEAGEIYGALD